VGPLLLRPDGTAFAVGATGATAIYTPSAPGSAGAGSWIAGPSLPAGLNVADGPGVVLPDGRVLFGASPGTSGLGLRYFEFDGASLREVPAPDNAAADAAYFTSLLPLPSGEVLFTDGTRLVDLYTPAADAGAAPAWAPVITSVSNSLTRGSSYAISGTQFNGFGQASAYGDESQNATNYPLVRLTNLSTGHVFYARTHDHSTMGVATGAESLSTRFDVAVETELGAARLEVVADGVPSAPITVTIVDPPAPPVSRGGGGGAVDVLTLGAFASFLLLRRRRRRRVLGA